MRPVDHPVLLDAWAARSCPVKTQNAFDPTIPGPPERPDPANSELFDGAQAFTDRVLDLLAALPGAIDLRPWRQSSAQSHRIATRRALDSRAPVVLAPLLPSSPQGHRTGSPDLLVAAGERSDGGPGWLPVIVKNHLVLERHHTLAEFTWVSPLTDPDPRRSHLSLDQTFRAGREGALLQAAHHWRLLEDLGLLADPAKVPGHRRLTGIIGTDTIDMLRNLPGYRPSEGPTASEDSLLGVAWLDLGHRFIRTFSRSAASGWRRRSVLDRYDHEHTFRVSVAEHAARRTGGPDDPEPMVLPIVVRECESCPWWTVCEPALGDDDLSLRISKAPLDVREIATLRRLGVAIVDDLATADLDSLLPRYLPEVQHRPQPERRVRLAARRARLIRDGVVLERNDDDPIHLPSGPVELDLDIETSPDDRVYLWGVWVDDPHQLLPDTTDERPYYVSFSSFVDMDDAAEAALAAQAIGWLDEVVRRVPECIIVHYSDYELVHLRRFGHTATDPEVTRAVQRLIDSGCFVDIFRTVRQHFFGVHGIGLKVVAQAGPGFHWRDADPGGLNSQTWWDQAVHDPDPQARQAAERRVMEYNEDDVRATHALRAWLREVHGARP
ncbi:TM0106 family RecB-like putative nuclease [Acidipropionibacterium timonense]|uniref:TM0106 family RecB-like putative nuclease n=1 Tax=Acidipropionibacterium timonense TaxID=2161818 RepID=UPI00102FA2D2|nr:TM0106 family RecB-like putative nuclease [Acidipropionibacterium timonense]